MREVLIEGERFRDLVGLHDHEAQAISEAVLLIPMPGEVFKCRALFAGRGVMNLAEGSGVELPTSLDGNIVCFAGIAMRTRSEECDRLFDHMVRGEGDRSEFTISKFVHDLEDALMTLVAFGDEREHKARVEKNHRGRRLPYRYLS